MASVIIDPGHGGSDPGAVYNGRQEKDDVLRLAKAVGAILQNSGVDVSYTRTDDRYETPFQKAMDANASGADFLISIHRNSGTTPNTYSGAQTLVYNDSGIRSTLARNINNELVALGFKDDGIVERPNLVVLRRSSMPAALVEVGFINNDRDNQLFDEKFNEIAQGIADGILTTIYGGQGDQGPEAVEASAENNDMGVNEMMNEGNSQWNESWQNDDLGRNVSGMNTMNGNNMGGMNNMSDMNSMRMNDGMNGMRMNDGMNGMRMNDGMDGMRMNDMNNMRMNDMGGMRMNDMNNVRMSTVEDENRKLYRVQVGAFRNKENADRMLNSLLSEGFPAFMIYDDGLYRVQVGAYEFLPNAIRMENQLRRRRYNTYITT